MTDWWHRLIYRLTHAGQWATPEWNLDPEPNMGPPWPETEVDKLRSAVRKEIDINESLRRTLDSVRTDRDTSNLEIIRLKKALSQKEKTP